jgi:hypothetical protein
MSNSARRLARCSYGSAVNRTPGRAGLRRLADGAGVAATLRCRGDWIRTSDLMSVPQSTCSILARWLDCAHFTFVTAYL